MGQVYIIHFSEPLGGHARHYVGWVVGDTWQDVWQRFREHCNGGKTGAKILKAAMRRQIRIRIVRIYQAQDQSMERRIKRQKNTWKHCPVCRAERAQGKQMRIKF